MEKTYLNIPLTQKERKEIKSYSDFLSIKSTSWARYILLRMIRLDSEYQKIHKNKNKNQEDD